MDRVIENFQMLGPFLAVSWAVTIVFTILRPQRYFNSFLLLGSLMVTMLFFAGFFRDENMGYFLLACFLAVMFAIFLVPLFLIINGVHMIRRESVCPAHLLSLGLGIVVGIGEIATVIYVLGISGKIDPGSANYRVLLIAFTIFYFSFLVLSFVIYTVFIQILPYRRDIDYMIIHGCGLADDGEHLGRLLTKRVDKAIEVYKKCGSRPFIIPSGGRGDDEKLSEAQAMKNYLLEHGIPEEKIILEDRSTTTSENIAFSKEIIESRGGSKRTALVSSNYHVYRCLRLARKAGLKCTGIGAPVALYYWPSALIREFAAVFLTKGFFIPAMIGYLVFISPVIGAFFR